MNDGIEVASDVATTVVDVAKTVPPVFVPFALALVGGVVAGVALSYGLNFCISKLRNRYGAKTTGLVHEHFVYRYNRKSPRAEGDEAIATDMANGDAKVA